MPVTIKVADKLAPEVRGLYLVIDYNPSPLAAHFVLGPLADARRIETRVRIDDYTYLHAVAETADGRLYATARFIKAAGGCSAPAGKDQALALKRLGKMKLTLGERQKPDLPVQAKLLISHPNNSGLQVDQLTHYYIPADFMQTLEVTYNGKLVFKLESDIAISEDPAFNFAFRAANSGSPGVLTAEILDSSQRRFSQSWPVPGAAADVSPARGAPHRRSPALQVRLGLGLPQLLDDRFDLRRIAEQADPASDPAAELQAERRFRLLVVRIGHQPGDGVDRARAFQQRLAGVAVRRHAADHVIRPGRGRVVIVMGVSRVGGSGRGQSGEQDRDGADRRQPRTPHFLPPPVDRRARSPTLPLIV